MGATLHDVCRLSKVSTATVSRVINDSPLVTDSTRKRVLKAIKSVGFHPSHSARTLARGRTDTLGVIFPIIASGFFTEILRGIDEIAANHNFHLMTAFSHGRDDEDKLIHDFIRGRRVDAVILVNLFVPDAVIRTAARYGTPIVLLVRPVKKTKLFWVGIDNIAGADAALTHLFGHGYREIALLAGPDDNHDARQRMIGCQNAAKRAGITLSEKLIWKGVFNEDSGREAVQRWWDSGRPLPQAIFAANDAMAFGAFAFLRKRGVRVPEDVALVGFDDVESASLLELTTVHVPMREMGRAAGEAAIQQALNGRASKGLIVPSNLVVRRSCGCNQAKPS